MSKHLYKLTVTRSIGNNLIALTHDRDLPFEILVGEKFENGDLYLFVTLENEYKELFNETLSQIINDM